MDVAEVSALPRAPSFMGAVQAGQTRRDRKLRRSERRGWDVPAHDS